MKISLTVLIALLLHLNFYGQSKTSATFNPAVDSLAEYLVSLAHLNPQIKAAENIARSTEYEFSRTKTAWLNNITVAGNLNEFSMRQGSGADPLKQSSQYPRYNVGVVLPLGLFINNGKQTKANYHRYEASVDQVNVEKQTIRRELLILWENYQLNQKLLELQEEVVVDANFLFAKQEERFAKGEMSLDAYTAASKLKNNEEVRKVTIIRDLRVLEAQIEALIGMRLADAIQQYQVRKQ